LKEFRQKYKNFQTKLKAYTNQLEKIQKMDIKNSQNLVQKKAEEKAFLNTIHWLPDL